MENVSQAKGAEPVAVLTLRTVKRGNEEKFEAALHDFISESLHSEGQLGVHVIRPPTGSDSREYGIVRRFISREARDNFYRSELFKKWEEKIAPMTEGSPVRQELTGLEAWFSLPGREATVTPPRWKMALATVVGVYPTSMLVPWLLQPLIGKLPPLLQAFFIAAGIVVILTWAVMPLLVKLLERWLLPREEA
ncbi:antibiotic biosynthesis monooxygenase [Geomesophilobacter sediminis]|uniref:Antibiotic biosynthesis monooxygenase n=1 Tax=Geomesophilobacter sediminis TaxID=2798584 RepID=A0A8J7JEG1_9BACT|nr:antibiotic biosynthesis monooxygenase [Geomesophilobacter sediminis]MBJ6724434.1 antibiotic biosynthesis monooxygenase [Geomesophilobacter sediminis]